MGNADAMNHKIIFRSITCNLEFNIPVGFLAAVTSKNKFRYFALLKPKSAESDISAE